MVMKVIVMVRNIMEMTDSSHHYQKVLPIVATK